jgi:AraC-like DNA-binding protein
MQTIPVISNLTLHGLPHLIRTQLGERTLARAVHSSGVDLEMIEGESCFIPHAAALRLIETAARVAGEDNFGLLMSPQMDVAKYGSYGQYIYAADTLGTAILRGIEALDYHSTGDAMGLVVRGDKARYSYGFALAGYTGYDHVASVAAGALSSVCRRYLSDSWRPLRIELDIPRPRQKAPFEDMFQCPVVFDAPTMTVVFDKSQLDARAPTIASPPVITISDVARDRRGAAPHDALGVVTEHIRLQVRGGSVSIDSTARALDCSIRTLQRELNCAGTDFRSLAKIARAEWAGELLRHTGVSVTRIATELGYSTPANFARAFRKATGTSPSEFRLADRRGSFPRHSRALESDRLSSA